MTELDQRVLESDVVVMEGESRYSRKAITVASGAGKLACGAVLGKVTASGKYVLSDPAAADGSETAVAVLLTPVDATAADAEGSALVRFAVINRARLSYAAGVTTAANRQTLADDLEAIGILVREGA